MSNRNLSAVQRGKYGESPMFTIFVEWIDTKWPGSGQLIRAAAEVIPWDKLIRAVTNAIADWQEGKDFLNILKEAMEEWIEFVPYPDGSDGFNLVERKCQ